MSMFNIARILGRRGYITCNRIQHMTTMSGGDPNSENEYIRALVCLICGSSGVIAVFGDIYK
jgi:hypothetical protein